jgi:3-hydroxybutyryl-CoA dehydrogenase
MQAYNPSPPITTTICICGAGTMGAGIAQTCALSGLDTTVYDKDASSTEQAKAKIEKELARMEEKTKITREQKKGTLGRLRFTHNPDDCVAEVIMEAIAENLEAKSALFKHLAQINGAKTILATNTSSLSVGAIAENLEHPERVIGIHFFNPAPVMKLVEIVKTDFTSERTIHCATHLVERLGKTAVVSRDLPGFIVNRVARPFYLEALWLAEEVFSDYQAIDQLMEASGFKMGPFRLMDLIGNDVNYAVSSSLYEALGKPGRLKPSGLQEQKVQIQALGKKTGIGFYRYPPP